MLILAVLASLLPDKSVPLNVVVVLVAKAEVLANNEAAIRRFFNIMFPVRYYLSVTGCDYDDPMTLGK